MFRKKPVLKYESAISLYPEIITPARKNVPEWYKKIPQWKDNEVFEINEGFKGSVKQCMPFLESLTVGYMITLPNDIYVKNHDGHPYLTWKQMEYPPSWRKEASSSLVPPGHYPLEYTWQTAVANTVPLGYSMLITHPLNRFDLPFTTLTGIVDGGFIMSPTGSIPFYIKENFEGIIHKGTPIIQIIPFYQQNWSLENISGLVQEGKKHHDLGQSVISGWYKKTFWTKKNFN